MPIAYHVIFGAYGFWLPNDPRGSWSEYVYNEQLLQFGEATHVHRTSVGGFACETANGSRARVPHDVQQRLAAKQVLKYPPVIFTGHQALAVSRGFSRVVRDTQLQIYACAIMPDHVHFVFGNHPRAIKTLVGQLKACATMQLNEEGLNPLAVSLAKPDGTVSQAKPLTKPPSPWARGCWKVFLDTEKDVQRAIHYVEQNPVKAGLRPQKWSFVVPYR